MVDADQWRKLEDLFYAVLDLPAEQRALYLDGACAGDPQLRQEVDSLLASAGATTGFLRKPVEDGARHISHDVAETGARIGPFRILSLLGEGGMGKVYLAARADEQFEQRVAIKMMHGGLRMSPGLLVRFRSERQILANLDHPNIARLLDGGLTGDGVPYLVMEYVDGTAVDDYCRSRGLSIEERLELFGKVCAAVEYAHKNLVIHRDIKCANILVTSEGNPKLLDFGIAKLLDPGSAASTETIAGERFLTPDYASPEQLRGESVTTATDVYMLGVLLYELLAGTRPFKVDTKSPLEAARIICERDAEAPSAKAASPADQKQLRGELDSIVLMAMRKEPSRRYASVGQFAADVDAYLRGFPVTAGGDSWSYRTAKFVRRHKAAVTAGVIVALALVGFGIGMGLLAKRANREQSIAQHESEFLASVFQAPEPEFARGRTVTALELLDRGSERINRELAGDDEARASLLQTMATAYQRLAKYDRALVLANDSYRLQTRLYGSDDPRTADILDEIATIQRLTGHYHEAEPLFRKALAQMRKRAGRDDENVANVMSDLGECLSLENKDNDAEPILREALSIHRRLGHDGLDQGGPERNYLALLLERRGAYPEAAELLREAKDIDFRLKGPDSPAYAITLHDQASNLIDLGDLAGAEKGLREDLAIRRKILGNDNPDLTFSLNNLSFVLIEKGDASAAEPLMKEALALLGRPANKGFQTLPAVENNWARFLQAKGDWSGAAKAFQQAMNDAIARSGPANWTVVRILSNQGVLEFDQGHYARAETFARQAVEMSRKLGGEQSPGFAFTTIELAEDRLFQGDPASAVPMLRDALAIRRKQYNPGNPAIISVMVKLGEALTAQGAAAEAEPVLRQAIQSAKAAPFPLLPWQTAEAENALGTCLVKLHHDTEGERLISSSQGALRTHPRPAFRGHLAPVN